ncbi:UbiA prenyltransferase family-domain-containing protein [Aspergillus karnatakaensis]|uniref:UbiA prenyltransferase family-domain-containing protein n=1 Tax=Aspergillus karnatakaensis TaxID=1810916 RepID=UPI003CCD16C0
MSQTIRAGERPPTSTTTKSLGWIVYLPSPLIPYAELARLHIIFTIPLATWQSVCGVLYGVAIVHRQIGQPDTSPSLAAASASFILASYLIHAFGCVWNDVVDQDIDRQTKRCRNRPVARGAVSTLSAVLYAMLIVWLTYLTLAHSGVKFSTATILYMVSMVAAATVYPLLKRITYYPQVWLGMTMSLEFLSAAQGILDLYQHHTPKESELSEGIFSSHYAFTTLSLTASVILFLVFFDSLYALSDLEDDLKSGAKGMAVLFKDNIPQLLAVTMILELSSLVAAGWGASFGRLYFLLILGGVGGPFLIKILSPRKEDMLNEVLMPMTLSCIVGALYSQI